LSEPLPKAQPLHCPSYTYCVAASKGSGQCEGACLMRHMVHTLRRVPPPERDPYDIDPSSLDWEILKELCACEPGSCRSFSPLDDEKWNAVWSVVQGRVEAQIESDLRFLVDDAALMSGYFCQYAPTEDAIRRFHYDRKSEALERRKAVSAFRRSNSAWITPEIDATTYSLWLELKDEIEHHDRALLKASIESAKRPEQDRWMARLALAWQHVCGLEIRNEKYFRAFITASMAGRLIAGRPMTVTDSMVRYFVKRWDSKEIAEPPPSGGVLRKFGDKLRFSERRRSISDSMKK
jgi:hypothetical protein